MGQARNVGQAQAQPPQPQIIIVKEERESLISKGIGSAFAPLVFFSGAAGMLTGAVAGAAKTGSAAGMVLGAFAGGVVVTTVATLGVKTIQLGADAALNCTFFVLKIPFKVTAYALNGIGYGLSCAYDSIAGSNASQVEPDDVTEDELLELKDKMA